MMQELGTRPIDAGRNDPMLNENPLSSPDLNIFTPGRNCWKVERADFVSIVVDYGNYYRDLHEFIVKARHSIFILGWDIDFRIELLRGEDAKTSHYPSTLFVSAVLEGARKSTSADLSQ